MAPCIIIKEKVPTYIARERFNVYLLFFTCNNFFQTEMETVNVLCLAQLHNQTDRVYYEMSSKEKVNT